MLIKQLVCLHNDGYHFEFVDSLSDFIAGLCNKHKIWNKVNKTGCKCH